MKKIFKIKNESVQPFQFIEELKSTIGMKVKEVISYTDKDFSFEWYCNKYYINLSKNNPLYNQIYREYIDWSGGPGTIQFDSDLIIGFNSDESKNSLICWVERLPSGEQAFKELLSDRKELKIVFTSPNFIDSFWPSVVGAKVKSISLLKQEPQTVMYTDLPNEVGIIFTLDNQLKIAVVHSLSEHGVFSMIPENCILDKWRPGLKEINVMEL